LEFLADYFKKFEADMDIVTELRDFDGGPGGAVAAKRWLDTVEKALTCHAQKVLTTNLKKNFDEELWTRFCKDTKDICYEAEICMSGDQYKIFSHTGHRLSAEAIKFILLKPDHMLCCLVFHYEPDFGLITEEISNIVKCNNDLYRMYLTAVNRKNSGK